MARACEYEPCSKSLVGMRSHARYCSRKHSMYARRLARRRAALLARPRCAICPNPLPYKTGWQGRGVSLSARTCSRPCAVRFYNWFRR